MTPEQFARFRQGTLLSQTWGMSGETLHLTEVRRDKETGLILRATFFTDTLLTLARATAK
jgi:hypothetical protein